MVLPQSKERKDLSLPLRRPSDAPLLLLASTQPESQDNFTPPRPDNNLCRRSLPRLDADLRCSNHHRLDHWMRGPAKAAKHAAVSRCHLKVAVLRNERLFHTLLPSTPTNSLRAFYPVVGRATGGKPLAKHDPGYASDRSAKTRRIRC